MVDGTVVIVTPGVSVESEVFSVAVILNPRVPPTPRSSAMTVPLLSTKFTVIASSVIVDAPASFVDSYAV
jgi:hypothetical protein